MSIYKHLSYIVCFCIVQHTAAQNAVKYSNEFLSIGVGARALGMSGTQVSVVDDVTSGFWNPAGLAAMSDKTQVALMHSEYFAGIAKFDYGAFATRIDERTAAGISVIRFGIDDIPDTSELIDANGNINYDRVTSFSAADLAVLLSIARKSKKVGLSFGASIKIVNRRIGDFAKAWGFGIDAGIRYQKKSFTIAACTKDVTTTFNAWSFNLSPSQIDAFNSTGNVIPVNSNEITLPSLTLGVANKFNIGKKITLLPTLDLIATFDGMRNTVIRNSGWSMNPAAGFEAGFKNLIFLRGGVGNFQSLVKIDQSGREMTYQPNIGLGLRLGPVNIDYAFSDIGDRSTALYSHIFSLQFNLKPKAVAAPTPENKPTP